MTRAQVASTAKREREGTAEENGRSSVFSKKLWMNWQLPKTVHKCSAHLTNTAHAVDKPVPDSDGHVDTVGQDKAGTAQATGQQESRAEEDGRECQ